MSPAPENEVTALIAAHADGDPTALDRPLPLVYDELRALASHAPRRTGRGIVELRFFGGLTIAETAAALGVSTGTVESDWAMARAWLGLELRAA